MAVRTLRLLLIVLVVATGILLSWNLYGFVKNDTIIVSSTMNAKAGSPVAIQVPSLSKYDRVYLVLNANTPITEIRAEPDNCLVSLPLDIEGVNIDVTHPTMMTRRFFYVANTTGTARLVLDLQSRIPYAIKVIEGKADFQVFKYNADGSAYVGVNTSVKEFTSAGFAQLVLVDSFGETAEPDFQISGTIRLLSGKLAYLNVILMTEDTWYAFAIAPFALEPGQGFNFSVNAGSIETFNRTGAFLGKKITFIALGVGLSERQWSTDQTPQVAIAVGDVAVMNRGNRSTIRAEVLDEYNLDYYVYILHKFQPTYVQVTLVIALVSQVIAFTYVATRMWRRVD